MSAMKELLIGIVENVEEETVLPECKTCTITLYCT